MSQALRLALQQAPYTIELAAAYALYAAGFVLIFGVLDVLNLAHGFVFVFGAAFAVYLAGHGFNLLAAMGIAAASGCALGMLLDAIAYRPLAGRGGGGSSGYGFNLGPVVSTLGFAGILDAATRRVFGIDNRVFPSSAFPNVTFHVGIVEITSVQVFVVAVALVILVVLRFVLSSTMYGRAVRAVAENRDMAGLVGINTPLVVTSIWALSSTLAALAGVLIGIAYQQISPTMGAGFEIKGFLTVIIGGLGSIDGAVLAAVALATIETGSVLYVSSTFRDVIALSVLLLVILVRPHGLTGRRQREV